MTQRGKSTFKNRSQSISITIAGVAIPAVLVPAIAFTELASLSGKVVMGSLIAAYGAFCVYLGTRVVSTLTTKGF